MEEDVIKKQGTCFSRSNRVPTGEMTTSNPDPKTLVNYFLAVIVVVLILNCVINHILVYHYRMANTHNQSSTPIDLDIDIS
jgi:hypothetical protein